MPLELTITLIILAILLIAVILYLITNTSFFSNILGGLRTSDIDTASQACALACSSQNKFDFCCKERDVKTFVGKVTCFAKPVLAGDCKMDCADYVTANCPAPVAPTSAPVTGNVPCVPPNVACPIADCSKAVTDKIYNVPTGTTCCLTTDCKPK